MRTLAAIGALACSAAVAAAWTPSVHIDSGTLTANQILPGLAGAYDAATNVNRVYMAASSGGSLPGGSLWSAVIKGTDATLKVSRASGVVTNAVYVSVDGGAFAAITASGTNPTFSFPLFAGLSDAEHYVVTRIGAAFGTDQMYIDRTLNDALTISGAAPYIELCNQWVYPGVASALAVSAGMTVASTANYTPAKSKQNILAATSNIGAAKIRGKFRSIQVASTGAAGLTKVYVSKNGAAPSVTTLADPGTGGTTCRIAGLTEETATYYVWNNHQDCSTFAVSGDADHVDCGTKYQMHQFGDSITYGSNADLHGEVDVLRVSAAMGYVGLTAGVSGHTIAQIETALTTYLAALTVTSNDVAIVAAGRNNTGAAFDAAETTSYTNIINALVTKGYGKIICRGILPSGTHSTTWSDENGSISSIVTGIGNANVVFCDVSGLGTYSTQSSDNVHPDAAGYATIAAYVEPLYRTILGL